MLSPKALEKEYETVEEYIQEQVNMLTGMHNTMLENVRKCGMIIKEVKEDLKKIKTPELQQFANNLLRQQEALKQQGLEMIRRSRKDLGLINQIWKQMRK